MVHSSLSKKIIIILATMLIGSITTSLYNAVQAQNSEKNFQGLLQSYINKNIKHLHGTYILKEVNKDYIVMQANKETRFIPIDSIKAVYTLGNETYLESD
jgi:hypothetical protein